MPASSLQFWTTTLFDDGRADRPLARFSDGMLLN